MINRFCAAIFLSFDACFFTYLHQSLHQSTERCDDDYDELLNVNNLSTNENKTDTGFPFFSRSLLHVNNFLSGLL